MKTIFKNKKYLTITIVSIAVILTLVIMIPTVFALSDNSGEIVEKQQEQQAEGIVESNQQETEVLQKEDTVSTSNDQTSTTNENIESDVDSEISQPIKESKLIKIGANTIKMNDMEFLFCEFSENDALFQRDINIYMTETLDRIEIDAKNNIIYKIRLSSETADKSSIKAKSGDDADLKAMADKLASEFCKDIGRYNSFRVHYEESAKNYYVIYARTINGYQTSEHMSVTFDGNLNFCGYYCMPNIFDGIDLSNITINETDINKQINDMYVAKYGERYGSFEIMLQRITVKNDKIILQVDTSALDKTGVQISQGALYTSEFEIG